MESKGNALKWKTEAENRSLDSRRLEEKIRWENVEIFIVQAINIVRVIMLYSRSILSFLFKSSNLDYIEIKYTSPQNLQNN